MLRTFALSALLAVGSVGAASAATIANGGFEDGIYPGGSFATIAGSEIAGWQVTAGSIDWINNYWTPQAGSYSLDLSGNVPGTIASSLVTGLTTGVEYVLSFFVAGNTDGGTAIKTGSVTIDGVTSLIRFDSSGFNRTDMGWSLRTVSFFATGSSATVSFASTTGDAYGLALDSVSVAAVPLPATAPLLLLAVGGFAALRRRRAA